MTSLAEVNQELEGAGRAMYRAERHMDAMIDSYLDDLVTMGDVMGAVDEYARVWRRYKVASREWDRAWREQGL